MSLAASYRSYGLYEFNHVSTGIEHLFPDRDLPISVERLSSALIHELQVYSPSQRRWLHTPVYNNSETHATLLCRFLNALGSRLQAICKQVGIAVEKRYWRLQDETFSEYGKQIPLPQLELCAGIDGGSSNTLVGALLPSQHLKSAFVGAWRTYSQHDDRRFYLCVEFGEGDFVTLLYYDHYRFARCREFNIHAQPALFLRMMAGFMLGSRISLGQKPSVATNNFGQRYLSSWDKHYSYIIIERLYLEQRYPSRATTMWHARENGDAPDPDILIKDYWEPTILDMETSILSTVQDLPGFMKIKRIEIVDSSDEVVPWFRGRVATTGKQAGEPPPEMRMRRLVLTPFASSLTSFSGTFELLCSMMDMLNAHYMLFKETGILHRNIAPSNMMLYWEEQDTSSILVKSSIFTDGIDAIKRQLPPEMPVRSGLLIGLSHSVRLPKGSQSILDPLCLHGVFLFMAIHLLLQGPAAAAHHVRHDLEAMFWVNCAIGVGYGEEHQTQGVSSHPVLHTWDILPSDNGATQPLAQRKWNMVCSKQNFQRKVLAYFLPQFEWLKPMVTEMRDLFFPQDYLDVERDTWHRDMMGILQDGTERLISEMQPVWNPVPEQYQVQTSTINCGPPEIQLEAAEEGGLTWIHYTPLSMELDGIL